MQWPKDEKEVRNLSQQELRWLLERLSLQQPIAIAKSAKGIFLTYLLIWYNYPYNILSEVW